MAIRSNTSSNSFSLVDVEFDFDFELAKERILKLNPNAVVLPVSAKTGEGLEQVIDWIMKEREKL